jgi:BirA family biotin operon repressor/biotin-[acetyl-CoA-carboxylase] ligase
MALDVVGVRERLPQREVVWLETTGSTMAAAARLAASGCQDGTAVVAEEQTAGQGRHGRRWHSERSSGLYVSIVMRPELPPESLLTLTLALGLATQEAILRATGISCGLKWPNDILACGKKCAGILTRRTGAAVIAGIGVNVNQESFPADLRGLATSLKMVSGHVESREDILVQLLLSVEEYSKLLHEQGSQWIIGLYSRASRKGRNHVAGS